MTAPSRALAERLTEIADAVEVARCRTGELTVGYVSDELRAADCQTLRAAAALLRTHEADMARTVDTLQRMLSAREEELASVKAALLREPSEQLSGDSGQLADACERAAVVCEGRTTPQGDDLALLLEAAARKLRGGNA